MTVRFRTLLALLAMSGCAQLATAQTPQLDSIKAKVALLDSIVGTKKFQSPQIPCADMEANRPSDNFPNGEYDLAFRNRQFGCAFTPAVATAGTAIAGLQVQVSGLATRLAALEQRVANLTAGPSGPIVAPTVEGGNLYVPGKVIIGGGCPPDARAQLQICGDGDANIMVVSNMGGGQYQSPAAHYGMWSLSGDGGMRIIQNAYWTSQCFTDTDPTNGVQYQNCMKRFIQPDRPYAATGHDSQGNWSFLRTVPGQVKDYTQDVVLRFYPDQKIVAWESWQIGWNWQIRSSTCRVCADRITSIQPQQ